MDTSTPADRFFGHQGFPSIFINSSEEPIENPETGDEMWSAEDIRITKMEGGLIKIDQIMKTIKEGKIFRDPENGDIYPVEKLYDMIDTFYQNDWLTEYLYKNYMNLLVTYEKELPRLISRERQEILGEPIQEAMELSGVNKFRSDQWTPRRKNDPNKNLIGAEPIHKL